MNEVQSRIIGLAMDRMRPCEIAKTLNVPVNSVYSCVYDARKRGIKVPAFRKGSPKWSQFTVSSDVAKKLRRAARARSLTPEELAEKVLTAAAKGNTITELLNDGARHG